MPKHNRGMRKRVKGRPHMATPHIGELKTWLRDGGYRETPIEERVRLLACWTNWAAAAGFTIDTVSAAFGACGAAFGESRNKEKSSILRHSLSAICKIAGSSRDRKRRCRHARCGRYSTPSAPGCAPTAASPIPRSTPIRRFWSIFSTRSATRRGPTRLTPYGRSFSNAPGRMARRVQSRSPILP